MGDLGSELALALTSETLWTAVLLAAPLIGITTLVGLGVSLLQVVTQIQESSLTFVPKLLAAVAVLLLLGGLDDDVARAVRDPPLAVVSVRSGLSFFGASSPVQRAGRKVPQSARETQLLPRAGPAPRKFRSTPDMTVLF